MTLPKWPLKHQWVNGLGYVVWRDVFEGNMKCPLDEAIAAHAQAVFVDEGDAKEYCAFKNTTPPAAAHQEPVAWVNHGENIISRVKGWDGYGALYAAPPAAQRQWVGLTDEQINQYDYQYRDLLYDVEKMLRENNA
jgi:hypothetical protein